MFIFLHHSEIFSNFADDLRVLLLYACAKTRKQLYNNIYKI